MRNPEPTASPPSPPARPAPREQWLNALIENVQDIVVLLDADARVLWESPAAERVLGYPPGELTGRCALDLVHPDDRAAALALLGSTVAVPGAVGSLTYRFRHRGGGWRTMEAVGKNLLHDPLIGGLVLNCRDITERVRTAEALHAAREAAERANRAKSEFLSRMSHELRTPLNAILGFAQLLELELPAGEPREGVAQIVRAGRHLLQLIDEVLEIARIEEGRFSLTLEPVRLAEVAAQAAELIRPLAAERGVRLDLALGARADRQLRADPQRLRQVLLNLLSNAVKYNRPGGRVQLRCAPARGRMRIEVRDTGPGIAPERQALLFQPFERLGAERLGVEGTGLGLAISRRLVELMDGSVGVHSRPGHGCTFWVELPLHRPAAGRERQPDRVREAPAPHRAPARVGTVLCIEDSPSNLQLVERLLRRRPGLHLLAATEGGEGLRLASLRQPDLVLLDLDLPDLSGTEILRRLRAEPALRAIPVVVVTADATAVRDGRLLAAGASACLAKPLDLRRLLDLIDELLG